ncbi:hypothetical protein LLEC1_00463 [Akanthomyces lecanii]|uniref:Phospholipase/carboxylesterase/thioesterase domain-containing protein n=1 Tax=Cordyceps confragosa TaxID=2714763 RepID=A0A179IG70_CORDF|nr:hypothetical protein LLEC1_00463 [Akanthomyces lecanii]
MEPSTHICGPAEGQPHTHTIIFLHGRDSDAHEFADELFESEGSTDSAASEDRTLPGLLPTVRWVFPTAPLLHSQRFDTAMSQWFDMWAVEDPEVNSELQRPGLHRSIHAVLAIIEAETKLVPKNRIFLCGISQGFATALSLLLGEGQGGFAGLIGLCSWLPFSSEVEAKIGEHTSHAPLFSSIQALYCSESVMQSPLPNQLKATPIFLGHALDDAVVPLENARRMKNALSLLGFNVQWHEYEDGGHWVNEPQGVDDLLAFIKENWEQS